MEGKIFSRVSFLVPCMMGPGEGKRLLRIRMCTEFPPKLGEMNREMIVIG